MTIALQHLGPALALAARRALHAFPAEAAKGPGIEAIDEHSARAPKALASPAVQNRFFIKEKRFEIAPGHRLRAEQPVLPSATSVACPRLPLLARLIAR